MDISKANNKFIAFSLTTNLISILMLLLLIILNVISYDPMVYLFGYTSITDIIAIIYIIFSVIITTQCVIGVILKIKIKLSLINLLINILVITYLFLRYFILINR